MSNTGSKYDDKRTTDWVGRIEDLAWALCLDAYNEGTLDTYKENRDVVKGVEFLTAEDELVCPICGPMNGTRFDIDESYGILPIHPWCRCAWVPITKETLYNSSKNSLEEKITFLAQDEDGRWVTLDSGQHVFIKEGESIEDSMRRQKIPIPNRTAERFKVEINRNVTRNSSEITKRTKNIVYKIPEKDLKESGVVQVVVKLRSETGVDGMWNGEYVTVSDNLLENEKEYEITVTHEIAHGIYRSRVDGDYKSPHVIGMKGWSIWDKEWEKHKETIPWEYGKMDGFPSEGFCETYAQWVVGSPEYKNVDESLRKIIEGRNK